MKKAIKIGIVICLVLLSIGTVFAIKLGDKLTQNQLDTQDTNNLELNPTFSKKEGFIEHKRETTTNNDYEIFYININSLEKKSDGSYEVVSKVVPILIDRKQYEKVIINKGIESARELLKFELIREKNRIENTEKAKAKGFQTKETINVDDLFKDFTLE